MEMAPILIVISFSISSLFSWGNLPTKKRVHLPETPFLPHTNTESLEKKKD